MWTGYSLNFDHSSEVSYFAEELILVRERWTPIPYLENRTRSSV